MLLDATALVGRTNVPAANCCINLDVTAVVASAPVYKKSLRTAHSHKQSTSCVALLFFGTPTYWHCAALCISCLNHFMAQILSWAWLFYTFYLGYIFLHSFLMQTAPKEVASSCFCPGSGTGSESRLFKGEVSVSIFAAPRTHKNLQACLTLLTICEENLRPWTVGIQTCRLNANI